MAVPKAVPKAAEKDLIDLGFDGYDAQPSAYATASASAAAAATVVAAASASDLPPQAAGADLLDVSFHSIPLATPPTSAVAARTNMPFGVFDPFAAHHVHSPTPSPHMTPHAAALLVGPPPAAPVLPQTSPLVASPMKRSPISSMMGPSTVPPRETDVGTGTGTGAAWATATTAPTPIAIRPPPPPYSRDADGLVRLEDLSTNAGARFT